MFFLFSIFLFAEVFGAEKYGKKDPWNPCAVTLCKPGEICINRNVTCVTAPCYPIAECQPKCGCNEHFNGCGVCDETCGEGPVACAAVCLPPGGCECDAGFCRRQDNGKCIPTPI